MAKRHDENNDLRSFGRIGSFNVVTKTLSASKAVIIGIRMWGKIDYLVNYCGYHFVWKVDSQTGCFRYEYCLPFRRRKGVYSNGRR